MLWNIGFAGFPIAASLVVGRVAVACRLFCAGVHLLISAVDVLPSSEFGGLSKW
jgi:hypothetical protein